MGRRESGKENCCGCGACAEVCAVRAIYMVPDSEGFLYPEIDESICVKCGRCKQVCPFKHEQRVTSQNQYFGVQAKNTKIRYSSSSGGMFPVLAKFILQQKGVVFGAGYGVDMQVRHMEIEDPQQLERIQRTKYVQSSMDGIYSRIEKRLAEDRWVLFCGTPCQASALRRFLGKPCDKLIVVDLICYGVPSPGIWSDYIKYLERKHGGKITDFSFRDKRNRDNGQMCSYTVKGKEIVKPLLRDKYCAMYFSNLIIRPSCHVCRFCTADRETDYTIGDFWGIERVRPDWNDGMVTSMLIVHTERAKRMWEQIKKELRWFSCRREDLCQPRLHSPTDAARERGMFMLLYKLLPFSSLMGLLSAALEIRNRWDSCRKEAVHE